MHKLTDKIVKALLEGGLIKSEDKETYHFGVEVALLKCVHFMTMLIIGIVFGMLLETVIFIACYSVLRIYAGGFHAKTKIGCYCISWIMIIAVLALAKNCPNQIILQVSLSGILLSTVIILVMSPVDSPNKPLDQLEIIHYRKKVRLIVIAYIVISVLFGVLHMFRLLLIVCLGEIFVSIMLILRKIQLKMHTSISS